MDCKRPTKSNKGHRDQNDAQSGPVAQKQGSVPKSRVICLRLPLVWRRCVRDPNNWQMNHLNGKEALIEDVQTWNVFSTYESGIPFKVSMKISTTTLQVCC